MRNHETGFREDFVSKQYQVEVERARGALVWALAAAFGFDGKQQVEHLTGRHRRGARERRIQEAGLRADADRISFVEAGDADVREVAFQPRNGEFEVSSAIAQVTAEGNRNRC